MKRSILRALALCLTATVVAGYAQTQYDNDKSKSTSPSRQPNTQGGPGTSSGTYSPGTQTSSLSPQAGQATRLSKLMNTSLRGPTGETLGQVQDIVVDPTSGQLQFVVLSLSTSSAGAPGPGTSATTGTGIGDPSISSPRSAPSTVGSYGTTTASGKLVAVPWRLLSYNSSSQQFAANVDSSKLQSAPTFSSAAWPTMDSAWMQRIYSHFGVDATGTGAPGPDSGIDTGTRNPTIPGLPSTPGTPDISPPGGTQPGTTPGTSPSPAK